MNNLLFILWNPDLYVFHLGSWGLRWYSTCWLIGLVGAYFMVKWLFSDQRIATRTIVKDGKKVEENVFDPLLIYCFLGILIGARLGHCLFYQPDYFLSSWDHVVEMILPIHHMADGSWRFVGYEGLASHGGTLGLMLALVIYSRQTGVRLWTVLDNIAIATPITACFIRLGNLMNSEIIGKVTDVPGPSSSSASTSSRATPANSTRPSPTPASSSWAGTSTATPSVPWATASTSVSASRSSSPSASSSSTPRTSRWTSSRACSSTWGRYSPSPSSFWGFIA